MEFIRRNPKSAVIGFILWLIINTVGYYRFIYDTENRLSSNFYQKGTSITRIFASKIGPSLLAVDEIALKDEITNIEGIDGYFFIEILDQENRTIAQSDSEKLKWAYTNPEKRRYIDTIDEVAIDAWSLPDNNQFIRFKADVRYSGTVIGKVCLALFSSQIYSSVDKFTTLFISIFVASTILFGLWLWLSANILKKRRSREQIEQENMTRVGPYVLIEKIGEGGMAEMFKAEHTSEDGFRRIVALKKVLPVLSGNQDFINLFIREARIAARLRHPNVIQITDYGRFENSYYIVMEYIDGTDLEDIIKRINKGLPIDLSVFIALKICMGLQYAHSKNDDQTGVPLNIVHRDINPQNVMVSYEGEIRIADFGIARAQSEPSLTKTGDIKGKIPYISPEQAMGLKVDCQTDIFAFGITFYEILVGYELFNNDGKFGFNRSILDKKIIPLQTIRTDIPDDLNFIVMKCLEKDKNARYQTAKEIINDLLRFKKRLNIVYDSTDLAGFMEMHIKGQISSNSE
jgi:hypothetical protein